MKHGFLMAILALLLVSCGGDDGTGPGDGGNNNQTDPVPTAVGTPAGTPAVGTIGAGGGSLASADGMFTLEVPPGALAADTEITIQPITNTAWGGVGAGYRLTPDGLVFSSPVGLVFELPDGLLAGSDAAFADVAVQRDDGVWGVLKNRTLDEGAGTLTCTTSHFSDYSLTEGVQIRPATATVDVNETVALSVRFCSRDAIPGDPDLVSLLISCDEELAPLGVFEDWSVNGVVGGSGTFGSVSPTSGQAVVYKAPAVAPNTNPVAVSVQTTFEGNTALLVANITVAGDEWVGTSTVWLGAGERAEATVTWRHTGTFGNVHFFAPHGYVEYTIESGDCAFVSLTPDTWLIDPGDGILTVDYSTDPPTYAGGAGTFWDAEHCYQCPEHPVQCGDIVLSPAWFAGDGDVHENGTRIDAIILDENDDPVMIYNFVKQASSSSSTACR